MPPGAELVIRQATPADAPACGQICYDAFSTISAAHGFPSDVPAPEMGVGLMSMLFAADGFKLDDDTEARATALQNK